MRQLRQSWIDFYIRYIKESAESPPNYHFWSGATVVAATLKRNVWIDRGSYKLYPNLYTILVGRPGIGKGGAVNPAIGILKEANTANLLSDRLTIEYVLEKLSKGFPRVAYQPAVGPNQSGGFTFATGDATAVIFAPELSIFITASAMTLPILADLWDAREGNFEYGTRTKGEYKVKDACISMLAGSTEEWLVDSIPINAIGGGFTRRVNFVYGKDKQKPIPWPLSPNSLKIRSDLVNDLRHISSLAGQFKFAVAARPLFESYYASCRPSEFDDTATASYISSKWAQAAKLSMSISASHSDSLEISKDDLELAINEIEACAKDIKKVFRAVGGSDMAAAGSKLLDLLEARGCASRSDILSAMWQHINDSELDILLNTLRNGKIIRETQVGHTVMYEPIAQKTTTFNTTKGRVI